MIIALILDTVVIIVISTVWYALQLAPVLLLVLIYEQIASKYINEMYLFSRSFQSFPVGLKWNITSIKATTYPTLLLGDAIRTQ